MSQPPFPQIAVIADAHVHDPGADLGFPGAARTLGLSVRPLAEAARSTRVFNESLQAFRAALDDVAARGIRHVVLLGDYTDDGQVATTASVAAILAACAARHGMAFYATPGNHDIFADAGRHRTKRFLDADGSTAAVTSHPQGTPDGLSLMVPAAVSQAMFCRGYPDGLAPMAAHGYFPQPAYRHWETPFGTDGAPEARTYAVTSPGGRTRRLMDASYLVEPADGLWLLMIDANVFVPLDEGDGWTDSTSAGWNAMLTHKPFVLDWMGDVAARAAALGKHLIAFSHYPALDPLDGTRAAEIDLLGRTAMSGRIPLDAVGEAFIAAGIRVHVGGHLHVNDTARMKRARGFLVNVAVPSLVGFPPAYKILAPGQDRLRIETIGLGDMVLQGAMHGPIAMLYAAEIGRTGVETGGMAQARLYGDFLSAHIGHLAWRRHLKREWPTGLGRLLRAATLADLEQLAGKPALEIGAAVESLAAAERPAPEDDGPGAVSGIAFLGDWYRLRMGSDLGLDHIAAERLAAYDRLSARYRATSWPASSAQAALGKVMALFDAYRSGLPSRDFTIDLVTGDVTAGAAGG